MTTVEDEETHEGIQAVLQELDEIADALRFKVNHVIPPFTNLQSYFRGKLAAYDRAIGAVRELQEKAHADSSSEVDP
jgi:hypothetical protein